jgi:hypothetical protein
MPFLFLKIFHFSPDSVCRFCFSDHNASARCIAREKEKRRQPESQTSVIEGEEVEEEREEEILYSDSSVDVTADQLPVEAFLAIDLEVTPVQRREWRLTRHLIKLAQFRVSADDEYLQELLGDERNELEQQGLSFTEIVSILADELNQVLVQRGNSRVNTTTRSRANLRKAVLSNQRYWKIPPPILEELLLKYSGPDLGRGNQERLEKIFFDLEHLVSSRQSGIK